jgi:hypothetical protein
MRRALLPPVVLAVLAIVAPAPAGAAKTSATAPVSTANLLWATINACTPADDPGAVGIRGSMPGDGVAAEHMFMRLQVQFQGPKGGWRFFPGTVGDSGFLPMGSAKQKMRQGGQTFQIAQQAQAVTLRGLVTYQWRDADGAIARHARKLTTLGHASSAGSDPAGFSAATCLIPSATP